jgi:hypothetical protein
MAIARDQGIQTRSIKNLDLDLDQTYSSIIPGEALTMTGESRFIVPDAISFEQAMTLSQDVLEHAVAAAPAISDWSDAIAALVRTENGARGFFVVYLSDDRPAMETLLPSVATALAPSPTTVSPLLVKNLAMSTAMGLAHRRHDDEASAQGSDRVRSRTLRLIQSLPRLHLQTQAHQLLASLDTGTGEYQAFLTRWGYDEGQKQAIRQAILATGLTTPPTDS